MNHERLITRALWPTYSKNLLFMQKLDKKQQRKMNPQYKKDNLRNLQL